MLLLLLLLGGTFGSAQGLIVALYSGIAPGEFREPSLECWIWNSCQSVQGKQHTCSGPIFSNNFSTWGNPWVTEIAEGKIYGEYVIFIMHCIFVNTIVFYKFHIFLCNYRWLNLKYYTKFSFSLSCISFSCIFSALSHCNFRNLIYRNILVFPCTLARMFLQVHSSSAMLLSRIYFLLTICSKFHSACFLTCPGMLEFCAALPLFIQALYIFVLCSGLGSRGHFNLLL